MNHTADDNPKPLVIGYGNPQRSDDALGPIAAYQVGKRLPKGSIRILTIQQLTPDLATEISTASRVVFIDATTEGQPGRIYHRRAQPNAAANTPLGHHLTPEALLAITQALHGKTPPAHVFSICAANLEFGDSLSDQVQNAVPLLVSMIIKTVAQPVS